MGKKSNGAFTARKLKLKRKKYRFAKKDSLSKYYKLYKKYDPFEGAPLAKGIVLQKVEIEIKQPHSGLRKCVKVQLTKNGKVVTAYGSPHGGIKFIDEHNEVLLERMGAPQRRAFGDIPGVKFRVIKVNGVSLKELAKGKKEKPSR